MKSLLIALGGLLLTAANWLQSILIRITQHGENNMSEQYASVCGEVRASRFVLVDHGGKERAVLELAQGEPILRLIGSSGRVQVMLGINQDGTTRLFIEGADIKTFANLGAVSNGTTTMEFGGSSRRIRASSNANGQNPTIVLTNDQGQEVGRLP